MTVCDEDTQRCDSLGPLLQESFLPVTSEERGHQGHLCGQGQTRAELRPSAAVKSVDGSPGLTVLLGRTHRAPPGPGPRAQGCRGAKDHPREGPGGPQWLGSLKWDKVGKFPESSLESLVPWEVGVPRP